MNNEEEGKGARRASIPRRNQEKGNGEAFMVEIGGKKLGKGTRTAGKIKKI